MNRMDRKPMFKKLMDEKLGGASAQSASSSPPAVATKASTVDAASAGAADERESLKGESDGEAKEIKSNSAARDVAFLQARLQDLMGKLKVMKKEKEAVEVNASNARQKHLEREEELMREHQKKQNEMQESFHLTLKQKEAEKLVLQKRIEESEKLREKFSQRNEESDELKDFQNQELGKVKHMLIIAQNQVTRLEAESASASASLARESQRVEEVERQLRDADESLQLKTAQLRSLEEKSAEDTGAFTSTLKEFRSEKVALQDENQRLTELLNQKVAAYSVMEEKLAGLEEDYARDTRAAEIYKREAETGKIAAADEKSQLLEKIQGLESRLSSADLGEDEKFEALEKDRQTLERRLIESREQLTEIKTTWSSKIEALEAQISHLNFKQVDDNADLAAKEEEIAQLKATYSAQIEDYQSRLREADSRHAQLSTSSEELKLKLERRIAQEETETERFRSESDRYRTEADDLRTRSEATRAEAEGLRSRVAELTAESEDFQERATALAESLSAAESSLLEAELTAEERTKELRLAKEEAGERERRSAAAAEAEAEETRRWREEAAKLKVEKETLSTEKAALKADGERLTADKDEGIRSLQTKLEEGEAKVSALEREKERWSEERREMEEDSRAKTDQIEKFIAEKSSTVDSTTSPSKGARESEEEQEEEEEEWKRASRETHRKLAADLSAERKEKDALLLRNAELSQNVSTLKSQLAAAAAEAVVITASSTASTSTTTLQTDSEERIEARSEGQQPQLEHVDSSVVEGGEEGPSAADMKKTIADLQTQLAEKNKTVKLQQQRIGDLRKTIQRELKMQSGGGGGGGNSNGLSAHGFGVNYGSSSEDLPALCAEAAGPPLNSSATSSSLQQIPHNASSSCLSSRTMPGSPLDPDAGAAYPLAGTLHPASVVPCSSITSNGLAPSPAAVLPNAGSSSTSIIPPLSASSPFLLNAGSSDVDDVVFPAGASATGEPSVVSFRYLKHVIIRFMISSEYEAQHLVKAVSTLLRFDKEEEKLVTDHLNYKVSWFGSKPSLKKLKSAKVRDVL